MPAIFDTAPCSAAVTGDACIMADLLAAAIGWHLCQFRQDAGKSWAVKARRGLNVKPDRGNERGAAQLEETARYRKRGVNQHAGTACATY